MSRFVHPLGRCESQHVGDGTRIEAFAHVLEKARIGEDCSICDHVFIENDVVLGDRVTVKCGVQLWDGITIGNDVFIGPNATFSTDRLPRSRHRPANYPKTLVDDGASIGASSTILPGIRIGQKAMIGAGAVVTKDVPPLAIIVGNPGKIAGYMDTVKHSRDVERKEEILAPGIERQPGALGAAGAKLMLLRSVKDLRGDLSVGEFETQVPFKPARYFIVFNVPSKKVRGEHAHKACHQFLVCVKGSVKAIVDDGTVREELLLNQPHLGLYLPPMVWSTQYDFSADSVLLVFASLPYDGQDYIREYADFLKLKQIQK